MILRYRIKCAGVWHWEEEPTILSPHPIKHDTYVQTCAIHDQPVEERVLVAAAG